MISVFSAAGFSLEQRLDDIPVTLRNITDRRIDLIQETLGLVDAVRIKRGLLTAALEEQNYDPLMIRRLLALKPRELALFKAHSEHLIAERHPMKANDSVVGNGSACYNLAMAALMDDQRKIDQSLVAMGMRYPGPAR